MRLAVAILAAAVAGCSSMPGEAWDSLDRPAGEPTTPNPGLLGYTMAPLYRKDVRTVHIEMLGSREFRRLWEFRLTEAIAKRVELDTGYRLVPGSRADTLLTGELTSINGSTLSEQPDTGGVTEMQFGHRIRWTWKDLRTGRILARREEDASWAFLYPQFNETPNLTLDAAIDTMARRVVSGMRIDF